MTIFKAKEHAFLISLPSTGANFRSEAYIVTWDLFSYTSISLSLSLYPSSPLLGPLFAPFAFILPVLLHCNLSNLRLLCFVITTLQGFYICFCCSSAILALIETLKCDKCWVKSFKHIICPLHPFH